MKKVIENRPVVYIGTDSLERTPILSFNFNEYQGVEKILRFIDRWKK